MLLVPAGIALAGITPVVIMCGAVYLGVAALGLARFAGWHEAQLG
jgi:hypothetical protein